MGREIRRVPLDFDAPLNTVWSGFINPHPHLAVKCLACDGTGSSPESQRLHDLWYGKTPFKPEDRGSKPYLPTDSPIWTFAKRNVERSPEYYGPATKNAITREAERLAELMNGSWGHHLNADDVAALVKAERLMDFTHTWDDRDGWKLKDPLVIPTPQQVNDWSVGGMGHDSINCWVVVAAECVRLGYPQACAHCNGEGSSWPSAEAEKLYDEWESSDPPKGDGYQLWETVSEGSPISPVFGAPDELADWLVTHSSDRISKDQWMAFIGVGWAPSMIVRNGRVSTGVKSIAKSVLRKEPEGVGSGPPMPQ